MWSTALKICLLGTIFYGGNKPRNNRKCGFRKFQDWLNRAFPWLRTISMAINVRSTWIVLWMVVFFNQRKGNAQNFSRWRSVVVVPQSECLENQANWRQSQVCQQRTNPYQQGKRIRPPVQCFEVPLSATFMDPTLFRSSQMGPHLSTPPLVLEIWSFWSPNDPSTAITMMESSSRKFTWKKQLLQGDFLSAAKDFPKQLHSRVLFYPNAAFSAGGEIITLIAVSRSYWGKFYESSSNRETYSPITILLETSRPSLKTRQNTSLNCLRIFEEALWRFREALTTTTCLMKPRYFKCSKFSTHQILDLGDQLRHEEQTACLILQSPRFYQVRLVFTVSFSNIFTTGALYLCDFILFYFFSNKNL